MAMAATAMQGKVNLSLLDDREATGSGKPIGVR
jgi:hypothetical protein